MKSWTVNFVSKPPENLLNNTPRSPASMVMKVALEKIITTMAMRNIIPKVPKNFPEGNPRFGWLITLFILTVKV